MPVAQNLKRFDFSRGWVPSHDAINAPATGLLRADNCVLDELGNVSARKGSSVLYTLADLEVHSLFASVVAGSNTRYAGAGAAVYRNGVSIISGMTGSGDIQFGAYSGQVLIARGSTKKKDNGTVRDWGVAAPAAPTISAVTGTLTTVLAGGSGEAAALTYLDGSFNSYVAGEDGSASAATRINYSTAGRAVATLAFGSPQNYSGNPDDVIKMFIKASDVANFQFFTLQFDCNDGTFHRDYFFYTFTPLDPGSNLPQVLPVNLPFQEAPAPLESPEGRQPRPRGPTFPDTAIRRGTQSDMASTIQQATDFSKVSALRGQFKRIGQTPGKDWSTVKAVRFAFFTKGGGSTPAPTIDIQSLQIGSGYLNGKYKVRYIYVANLTEYQIKGATQTTSSNEVQVEHGTLRVPVVASSDSQVDAIWIYVLGGGLDNWYRAHVAANATASIDLAVTERDMLLLNEILELDNEVPPNNIIGIAGPWYDRMYALTSDGLLHPSRRLNPDSYSAFQALQIADFAQTYYWVAKTLGGLYVGASADIYRVDGDGAELPDGSINFRITPLNIDSPPIASGFAQEGNRLVYVAKDGWREFNGLQSVPMRGDTDLLWKDRTRYGVAPINTAGRFRATMSKQDLLVIAPEEVGLSFSRDIIYRFNARLDRWYRHQYPYGILSLYREIDGTLVAGDNAGNVRLLDQGNKDGSTAIPVEIWTKLDDDGLPLNRKIPFDYQIHINSGGENLAVELFADKMPPTGPGKTLTASGTESAPIYRASISDFPAHFRVIQRMTGNFTAGFILYGFDLAYRPRPQAAKYRDTGYINLDRGGASWLRGAWITLWTDDTQINIAPYMDDSPFDTLPLTVTPNKVSRYWVPFPRNYFGYQPRLVLTPNDSTKVIELDRTKWVLDPTGDDQLNELSSVTVEAP